MMPRLQTPPFLDKANANRPFIADFKPDRIPHFPGKETISMWMKNTSFQRLGGGSLETIGLRLWSRLQFTALRGRKDPHIVGLLEEIHDEKRSLLSAFEAFIVTCPP